MIHFLLLPIGFVLGAYVVSLLYARKLEALDAMQRRDLERTNRATYLRGCRDGAKKARALLTLN